MHSAPSIGNTAHHELGVSLVFHLSWGKFILELNIILRGSQLVIRYSFVTSLSQLPTAKCGLYRQCNEIYARL